MLTFNKIKKHFPTSTFVHDSTPRTNYVSRTVPCLIFLLGCTPAIDRKGSTSSVNFFSQTNDSGYHWRDSGYWWSDTGYWSDNVNAIYGCNVPSWGTCYDHYTIYGWDEQSAIASCEFIASQYEVSSYFIEHPGCPTHNAVGECEVPAGGDFAFTVSLLYDASTWTSQMAETACLENGGVYYGF